MSATGCIGEVLAHNTPADNGQIVYDERGMIVREAFGRSLSKLETALCDALDVRNIELRAVWGIVERNDKKPRTFGHGI